MRGEALHVAEGDLHEIAGQSAEMSQQNGEARHPLTVGAENGCEGVCPAG